MENELMTIKILLPFRIFAKVINVTRVVAETGEGYFGILPQRLDCVAALVPGIFTYETEREGVQYLAIDEGILVKAGPEVLVSVRNAIGGANLGKLRESVEKDFVELDENERKVRSVMAKLESGFIYNLEKFSKE
jgi:F-type H+-transporting ATPase subunit epsilon